MAKRDDSDRIEGALSAAEDVNSYLDSIREDVECVGTCEKASDAAANLMSAKKHAQSLLDDIESALRIAQGKA